MPASLAGKIALVTGGGTDIGEASALALAKAGVADAIMLIFSRPRHANASQIIVRPTIYLTAL